MDPLALISGENYSAANSQIFGRMGPSQANQMIPDAADPMVYSSSRWVSLLAETDSIRRAGNFALAEKQYNDLLAKLRQAQDRNAFDAGSLLDHIGDFYLDIRDFDKAYPEFAEAVLVRRDNLKSIPQSAQTPQQQQLSLACRNHLVKLLISLGRIDSAKGNFAQANTELSEAVQIGNELARLGIALDAVYFESLLLEKQNKWADADALWQQAVKARDKMTISDPYWDSLKEQAAFYARRGDFHTAAAIATAIATRVQAETAGKQFRPAVPLPTLDDAKDSAPGGRLFENLYKPAAAVAMNEIIALDRWVTSGPDAAAPLLTAPALSGPTREENTLITQGSGSQQARFLAFLTQRAFLHMSALLDGNPTPGRVEKAYEVLQPAKGRYLDNLAEITRLAESDRDNPHVSYSASNNPVAMLDQLAAERARLAHTFAAAALDGKQFGDLQFAAGEQAEEAIAEGLAHAKQYQFGLNFHAGDPSRSVPAGAAFIDIAAWERADRSSPAKPHREYGAFIFRRDRPPAFVRLAPAADIDTDVDSLETLVVGPHVRGIRATTSLQSDAATQTANHLKRLYQEVIAPMESPLAGVTQLLIVPDGKLTLAPIEAFTDAKGQYLLSRYTVTYLSSSRSLSGAPDLNPRGEAALNKTKPPLIVANPDFSALLANSVAGPVPAGRLKFDPLPGAGLEAGDVQKALLITPDRVLTGRPIASFDAREDPPPC